VSVLGFFVSCTTTGLNLLISTGNKALGFSANPFYFVSF
jgi:hypothetical protein